MSSQPDRSLILAMSEKSFGASPSTRRLVEAFGRLDWSAEERIWDAIGPGEAPVLVRHTWDYHKRLPQYIDWLDRLEAAGTPVQNAPRVLRWNTDKRYLTDLDRGGLPVPTTVFVPGADALPPLNEIRDRVESERVVVKPTIAATAWRTRLVDLGDEDDARAAILDACSEAEAMVQPYLPAVESGEWSLVYFGGVYSHAALKTPAAGDFRVQSDFGGAVAILDPPSNVREVADRVVDWLSDPLAYLRVDAVAGDDGVWLMEVEAIEPELFLDRVPDAADRFARYVVSALS